MQKALAVTFLALFAGLAYPNAYSLAIYILKFTVADHDTHVTREFGVILYDHEHDHKVTLDVPDDILETIEAGCKTSTLSFPGFYTCESGRMTVDLHSSSYFIITFV